MDWRVVPRRPWLKVSAVVRAAGRIGTASEISRAGYAELRGGWGGRIIQINDAYADSSTATRNIRSNPAAAIANAYQGYRTRFVETRLLSYWRLLGKDTDSALSHSQG